MRKIVKILLILCICSLAYGCSKQSENIKVKEFSIPSAEINTIEIVLKDIPVNFVISETDTISLSYSQSEKNYFDINEKNGTLSIRSKTEKEFLDYIGFSDNSAQSLTIEIPAVIQSDFNLKTSNSDIVLPEIDMKGNVNIDLNNGDILFDKIMFEKDTILFAKNGNIKGKINNKYEEFKIVSEAHKGESNLPDSKKNGNKLLNVSTNNGDVEIEFE
ncbi:DUF4097 family beta strand repeat-containing protein [Clostridioides difficile]